VQEWSYGYRTLDSAKEIRSNRQVRVLKQLDVFEFSPVLRGMGSRTGTLGIKSAELKEGAFADLIAGLGEMASALGDGSAALSEVGRKQLADIHVALTKALTGPGSDAERAAHDALVQNALGMSLHSLSRAHLNRGR
jgi:hypothetical protein